MTPTRIGKQAKRQQKQGSEIIYQKINCLNKQNKYVKVAITKILTQSLL